MDIESRFLNLTSKLQGQPVTLETKLVDDLGLDSLDIAELLLAYEDEFNVLLDVDSVEINEAITLNNIFEVIKSQIL